MEIALKVMWWAIHDPRAVNVLIIAMFLLASVRWSVAGDWIQAGYWASAALLNVFITLGIKTT